MKCKIILKMILTRSIWPIDGQSGPGINGSKGLILHSSELQSHHYIQFNIILRTYIVSRLRKFSKFHFLIKHLLFLVPC